MQGLSSSQAVPDGDGGPLWQAPDPSQTSLWVQGSESLHAVPAEAAEPGWQVGDEPLQASFWVQGFPSLHAVPGEEREAGWQAPEPLQASFWVQGLPSLHAVPADA